MALTCQLVWFKCAKGLPVREVRSRGAVIDTLLTAVGPPLHAFNFDECLPFGTPATGQF
jgi:hypothetical protein